MRTADEQWVHDAGEELEREEVLCERCVREFTYEDLCETCIAELEDVAWELAG